MSATPHPSRRPRTTSRRRFFAFITIIPLAVVMFGARLTAAPGSVDLGTAGDFAVLAGSTITNTGPTTIVGDIGLHPGTSVTGFGPGADAVTQSGALHIADAVAAEAKIDLGDGYDEAAARPATQIATELGGAILTGGVYDSAAGTFEINGTLTLDADNDPDAVFVFQMDSTLTTASASVVSLINGADPCNVYWVVGSSATLGTFSSFSGTILALASITVTTGVTVTGQALAREGAVTMDSNTITAPLCAAAIPTPTPTATPTPTPSATPTPTPSLTPTATPTPSPTIPAIPAVSPTPIVVPAATGSTPIPTSPEGSPEDSDAPTEAPNPRATSSSVTVAGGVPQTNRVALDGGAALPNTGAPMTILALMSLGLIATGLVLRRFVR